MFLLSILNGETFAGAILSIQCSLPYPKYQSLSNRFGAEDTNLVLADLADFLKSFPLKLVLRKQLCQLTQKI